MIALRLQLALHLGEEGELADAISEATAALGLCGERGFRNLSAKASGILGGLKLLTGQATEAYDLLPRISRGHDIAESAFYLGFGELVRRGNILTDHVEMLPAAAVTAGRPEAAIRHLLRQRADVSAQFGRIKSILRSSANSTSIVQEYDGLHQVLDVLAPLMASDSKLGEEAAPGGPR